MALALDPSTLDAQNFKQFNSPVAKQRSSNSSSSSSSSNRSSTGSSNSNSGQKGTKTRPSTHNRIIKSWKTTTNGMACEYQIFADGKIKSIIHNTCIICHGSGCCRICGGTGVTVVTGGYARGQRLPCSYCNQSGRCPTCAGSGTQKATFVTDAAGRTYGGTNGGSYVIDGIVYDRSGRIVGTSGATNSESSSQSSSQKKVCPHCHGTRSETTYPEWLSPNSDVGCVHFNRLGQKCHICGDYRKHWHSRCMECNTKLWNRAGLHNPYY